MYIYNNLPIMNSMSTKNKRTAGANIAGALGYLSLVLQWMWSLVIAAYPIISGEAGSFLFPERRTSNPTPIDAGIFTPVVFTVAAIVTVLVLALTIVVVARLPKAIANAGSKATKAAASAAIPLATHHTRTTKKQRLQLSFNFVIIIKLLLIVMPLVILVIAKPIEQLPPSASLAFGSFCALSSFTYFAVQYAIVYLAHVDKKRVL